MFKVIFFSGIIAFFRIVVLRILFSLLLWLWIWLCVVILFISILSLILWICRLCVSSLSSRIQLAFVRTSQWMIFWGIIWFLRWLFSLICFFVLVSYLDNLWASFPFFLIKCFLSVCNIQWYNTWLCNSLLVYKGSTRWPLDVHSCSSFSPCRLSCSQ